VLDGGSLAGNDSSISSSSFSSAVVRGARGGFFAWSFMSVAPWAMRQNVAEFRGEGLADISRSTNQCEPAGGAQARSKSIKIQRNPAKPEQNGSKKKAWIPLDLLGDVTLDITTRKC
jgi:hypothetical protein